MKFTVSAIALLILTLPSLSQAVCIWKWQGINSHWQCPPGDSPGKDYSNLFKAAKEDLTGECSQAIGIAFEKDFLCLLSIQYAVEAGSLIELGGAAGAAGKACPAFYDSVENLANKCKSDQRVRFIGGPTQQRNPMGKACNNGREQIRVAVGYQGLFEEYYAMGWHVLAPGQCQDLVSSPFPMYFRAESLDGQRAFVPPGKTGSFCVGSGFNLHYNMPVSRCDDFVGNHRLAQFGQINAVNGVARFDIGGGGNGGGANGGGGANNAPLAWGQKAGKAYRIAAGPDGTHWKLGPERGNMGFGYNIYRLVGTNWQQVQGEAVRLAVDPRGNAWVVNNRSDLYRYDGNRFVSMQRKATDISISTEGAVWIIGDDAQAGGFGYGIYQLTKDGWRKYDGAGIRIAVTPSAAPYVVNTHDQVWFLTKQGFVNVQVSAKEIAVGKDGVVWAISSRGNQYGGEVLVARDGFHFTSANGFGTAIAVDPINKPLVVNAQGDIWGTK